MTQFRVFGFLFVLVVVTLARLGLRAGLSPDAVRDPVVMVADDDQEMSAAITQARQSVQQFIDRLKNPDGAAGFAVKKEFVDGKKSEYMWLSNPTFDGKVFRGRLDNQPGMVANVKQGALATVKAAEVADWFYIEDGKLVGGYSIRLLFARMTPEEKEKAVEALPFRLE